MVPTALLPPVRPFTAQVTGKFGGVVVTVTENCLVAPAGTVAVVGEIATGGGSMTFTVVDAIFVVSATETTVTVTWNGLMTLLGLGAV